MMNPHQRALREFQDFADDVSRARHKTIIDALQRFVRTLAPGTPLGGVTAELPEVDFDQWYRQQLTTGGSMIGSSTLSWPEDPTERLALTVQLIRHLASGEASFLNFTQ